MSEKQAEKRSPGRPRKYAQTAKIAISLPADMAEQLRRDARAQGTSVSALVVEAIAKRGKRR